MLFLLLILICGCIYVLVQNQDLGIQVKDLLHRVQELENQLRKLHVKIVSQMPGFLEAGGAKEPPPAQEPERDCQMAHSDVGVSTATWGRK